MNTIRGERPLGDYMRGVQDCLEYVLMMMKECRDIKELKEKVQKLLGDILEKKYINLRRIFSLP